MRQPSNVFSSIAPVLRVNDLPRSLAFYRDQLGFELAFSYEDFYAGVRRDGCHIHLQCASPAQRDQAAFEKSEYLDACIVIPDAETIAQSFAAAGVAFTVPLRQAPYGTEFYIRDPDGYILGFVQPPSGDESAARTVQAVRADQEVMTRQRLPYFIGISGKTVGASGLSMHIVVIPPGARAEPHVHIGYETGIYVLEGQVCTRWGDSLEHEVVSGPSEFLFVPPGVPHEAINLSATEPARAVVARNDPAEQDKIEPYKVTPPADRG